MSTKLSRINWAALAKLLDPYLPDLHMIGSGVNKNPKVADVQVISKDPDIMPQLQLLLGSRFTPVKGENGLYSFKATAAEMVRKVDAGEVTWDGTDRTSPISINTLRGILMLMKIIPRGTIMPAGHTQSKGAGLNYCRFVPLILAAWKKHKNIKYSEWDWSEPAEERRKLLDKDFVLYSDTFYKLDKVDQFGSEELQDFRDKARLVFKTGEIKAPEATATITKQNDPTFRALPELLQFSLLQLWCACPHLWNENMITNPLNLDSPTVSMFGESTTSVVFSDPRAAHVEPTTSDPNMLF